MSTQVSIVAVGARTPVGVTAEQSAASVRARLSRLAFHPFMVDARGAPIRCARDLGLDPKVQGTKRLWHLAANAFAEIVSKLPAQGPELDGVSVLLAVPEPRPGQTAQESQWLAHALAATAPKTWPQMTVRLGGEGHAGALQALELGVQMLEQRQSQLCIVLAVDSYLQADTLDWLHTERRLGIDGIPNGFPPGEAAGALVLASEEARLRLRLPSLARVRGVATAHEPRSLDSDEGVLGEALAHVIARASQGSARPAEPIDDVICDMSPERFRADDWAMAAMRMSSLFRDPSRYRYGTPEWGEVGAATGALSCILAIQAWRRRYAAGPRAMVLGSSWGGLRGAALLERGADA